MKKAVSFYLVGCVCCSCYGQVVAEEPLFHQPKAARVLDPGLPRLAAERGGGPLRAWVWFTDKGIHDRGEYQARLRDAVSGMNPRTLARRAARRQDPGVCDHRDLPVNPAYVRLVEATGAKLRVQSRWANAVSVAAALGQLERIATMGFVRQVTPVRRSMPIWPIRTAPAGRGDPSRSRDAAFYGVGFDQLQQINVPAVHDLGYTGLGVAVGILDTGFNRGHEAFNEPGHEIDVIDEYDFVDDDNDTSREPGDNRFQADHGTLILGTLAGYKPAAFVGSAYDASFLLAKTEDITQEVPAEEDNYVAGIEWLEANGADMATSSLGYIDWYTQSDLDGTTAVTTIAVNTATANGMVCCTAAGNSGNDSNPNTSRLVAPGDAFDVLTCGAVDLSGTTAWFSSDGPTADGRTKPELLALGVGTRSPSPTVNDAYTSASGTSLSTPLVAGAVALIIQAHPDWSVRQIRNGLLFTASDYSAKGQADPLFVRGYGLVDALAAIQTVYVPGDIDADGDVDLDDFVRFAACFTGEGATGTPPGCGPGDFGPSDMNGDGEVDLGDFITFATNFSG